MVTRASLVIVSLLAGLLLSSGLVVKSYQTYSSSPLPAIGLTWFHNGKAFTVFATSSGEFSNVVLHLPIILRDYVVCSTKLVSVASSGAQGNGETEGGIISSDGLYVVFWSNADNLVGDDTNGVVDVFVHEIMTRQTTRVSIASDGVQGNDRSFAPDISADGRYIVFDSWADNLVSNDSNGVGDVFVHDRLTGQTTRVSLASDGTQGNSESMSGRISADGQTITFLSWADNLVEDDTNGETDAFVHSRQTGITQRVSISNDGREANADSSLSSISDDGRFIAFSSWASNLIDSDADFATDVYLYDRQTGQLSLVSVASDGTKGNRGSIDPSISGDGRLIAFFSDASNLVADDTNEQSDVFVHDRLTGQTRRVSVTNDGIQGNDDSSQPFISSDGQYVVFSSKASNMVSKDTNGWRDVFLHDLKNGKTTLVSISNEGKQGNDAAWIPSMSAIGPSVTFISAATNLVSGDTNNTWDVFVRLCGR